MLQFNEQTLLATLKGMPLGAQAAFAQACATRALGWTRRRLSEGALQVCETSLACAFRFVQGESVLQAAEASLGELNGLEEIDEDGVAACAFALRHLISGNPQEALWAARRAYEFTDQFAQDELGVEQYSRAVEEQLLAHPTVQRELTQQANDLSALANGTVLPVAVVLQAKAQARTSA